MKTFREYTTESRLFAFRSEKAATFSLRLNYKDTNEIVLAVEKGDKKKLKPLYDWMRSYYFPKSRFYDPAKFRVHGVRILDDSGHHVKIEMDFTGVGIGGKPERRKEVMTIINDYE